jgi:hypothetical protein
MPPYADAPTPPRPLWQRAFWLGAGALSLLTGIVGIFLPLLPTTPFVLLAAFCFSRGSARWEAWMLSHPRFGPIVRDWREHQAVRHGDDDDRLGLGGVRIAAAGGLAAGAVLRSGGHVAVAPADPASAALTIRPGCCPGPVRGAYRPSPRAAAH